MKQQILFQRLESVVIFLASTYLYFSLDFSLVAYLLLLFIFDISMIGYIKSTTLGAYFYNIAHSYTAPIVITVAAYAMDSQLLLGFGLIWIAHISLDRGLGYGLKMTSAFTDTHLGKIGKH